MTAFGLDLRVAEVKDQFDRHLGYQWYLKITRPSGEPSEYISKKPAGSLVDCYNDFSEWMEIAKDELLQQSFSQLLEHVKDELSEDKQ